MRAPPVILERLRRLPPPVPDAAMALGILAVGCVEILYSYWPDGLMDPHRRGAVALLAIASLGVALRRVRLWAASGLVIAAAVTALVTHVPFAAANSSTLTELILLYTLAEHRGTAVGVIAMVAVLALDYIGMHQWESSPLAFVTGDLLYVGLVWFAGWAQARRRAVAQELERSASDLRDERERLAQSAVAAERARIARDLHAIVVRGVERINDRSRAARDALSLHPSDAVETIESIEATGRETLVEMRRLLFVLRMQADRAIPSAAMWAPPDGAHAQPSTERLLAPRPASS
jgi:signal transduction histidine kinase